MKKKIALTLCVSLLIGLMALPVAAAELAGPVIEGTTITIASANDLQWVSDYSNGVIEKQDSIPLSFKGYTLNVTQDIDLGDRAWTPIDNFHGTMRGTVDGAEYATISNFNVLKDTSSENYAGLFGNVKFSEAEGAPVLENICVSDVELAAQGYAGALIGQAYIAKITNCHAKNVKIEGGAYLGGLVGSGYCTITNSTADSVTIVATKKNSEYDGDNVGGLLGFLGEGNVAISDCSVTNSSVTGCRGAGGVVGSILYGNKVLNCKANEVAVRTTNSVSKPLAPLFGYPAVGGIVGEAICSSNGVITISGCEAKALKLTSVSGDYPLAAILGYARKYNASQINITENDITQAGGYREFNK